MGLEAESPQALFPLEKKSRRAWDTVARAPVAMTLPSLLWSRRNSRCKLFSRAGTGDPGPEEANRVHSGGSRQDFVVAWDLGAITIMPCFGKERGTNVLHPTLGRCLRGLPGASESLEVELPGNLAHPRAAATAAAGLMTFHLDLSPQPDPSEVGVSAGSQGGGVSMSEEKGFLNQRSWSPEDSVSSRLLDSRAYGS